MRIAVMGSGGGLTVQSPVTGDFTRGRQEGISTPLNFAVDAALKPHAEGAPAE